MLFSVTLWIPNMVQFLLVGVHTLHLVYFKPIINSSLTNTAHKYNALKQFLEKTFNLLLPILF